MIDKIIGFIGAGNMGSAMIGGIVHSELVTTSQIIASAHSAATLEKLQSTYSIETTLSSETVAERSDILFLAVKPNKFDEVICSIRLWFSDDIYSIGIEDIKKISILNNNENIDVKFGGKYIVKNVSKISGYIVFYNYCEQLRNIKLFYEKIKANFKSDIEFHKIAKVYIL